MVARASRWFVVGVATALVAVLALRPDPGGGRDRRDERRAAPALELREFDGTTFSLSDYRGTPVVVNFWASWCPPCAAEMPVFEEVHRDLSEEVAFVGVNQRDARAPAERLARETGVTYRLAYDPSGRAFDALGALGMPLTVFVDGDGYVVDSIAGQLSEAELRGYLARYFGVPSRG